MFLRVIELKLNCAPSYPNGLSNTNLPEAAFTNHMIYKSRIPNDSDFGQFLDAGEEHINLKKPLYELIDADIEQFPVSKKLMSAGQDLLHKCSVLWKKPGHPD